MKILNLYAGIGGNRKLWGNNHDITAVEIDPDIAKIYSDFFPDDKMVVGDAHEYLLEHFGEYDFIWSSPPCPTHSRINKANHLSPYKDNTKQLEQGGGIEPRYPEMSLYQEIIFLQHFCKAKWVVENVKPYYKPLIPPTAELHRHLFWSNFYIPEVEVEDKNRKHGDIHSGSTVYGVSIKNINISNKVKILRNMVDPNVGEFILKRAQGKKPLKLF